MKLKTLILLSCLVAWLAYSCEDTGPEPIDTPDPTDTMPMDSMPMDTMPMDTMPMDTMPMDTMPMDTMPMDTMPMDTMPMDTTPIVDTTGTFLINQIKGNYLGTCYHLSVGNGHPDFLDTTYNVTITIDSIVRLPINGDYYYVLYYDFQYTFYIKEADFIKNEINTHANGGNQAHTKDLQFIRSQRFLYAKTGQYPGAGFSEDKCYCYKQ